MQVDTKLAKQVAPVDPPAVVLRKPSHESSSGEENYFECHEKDSEKPFIGEVIEGETKAPEVDEAPKEEEKEEEKVNPEMSTIETQAGELKEETALTTETATDEDASPVCDLEGGMATVHASTDEKVESSSHEVITPSKDDTKPRVVLVAPSSPAPSVTGTVNSEDDGVLEQEDNDTPLPPSIIQKLEALKEIDAPNTMMNSKPVEKDLLDAVFERAELFLCAPCISGSTAQEPEQRQNERDLLDDVFERVDIFENASRAVTNFQTSPDRKPPIPAIPQHDVLDDFFETTEQIIRNFSDTPVKSSSSNEPLLSKAKKKSGPYRPDLLDLFFETAEKLSASPQSHGLEIEEDAGQEVTAEIIVTTSTTNYSKTTHIDTSQPEETSSASNQPDLLDQFFESAEGLVQRGCNDAKTVECANT
jgi:hypothetical protein